MYCSKAAAHFFGRFAPLRDFGLSFRRAGMRYRGDGRERTRWLWPPLGNRNLAPCAPSAGFRRDLTYGTHDCDGADPARPEIADHADSVTPTPANEPDRPEIGLASWLAERRLETRRIPLAWRRPLQTAAPFCYARHRLRETLPVHTSSSWRLVAHLHSTIPPN